MRLTQNVLGQEPRTEGRRAWAGGSEPEIRVASAVAARGAHGEPHRCEPSSAVLASWATSTARFPGRSPRMSTEQVPCRRLLLVSPERKREFLGRLHRCGCILARLLRG